MPGYNSPSPRLVPIVLVLLWTCPVLGQRKTPSTAPPAVPRSLQTPLPQETLRLLANEVSGQIAYNNLVKLAGAPWLRAPREFSHTLYESQTIHEVVREYGISTARLERHPDRGTFDWPMEGEFWILEPEKRLVARLEADAALIARGSQTADITAELCYVPPGSKAEIQKAVQAAPSDKYRGKLALMWSHPSDEQAAALAEAGIQGVIAFNSRERYFDPGQVVYSSGPYDRHDPLRLGFSISWRQWSELLEDLQLGKRIVVRAKARLQKKPDKLETVYSWIPGTEPEGKGIVFTAHLFDGPIKRGANDNMSGCAIQLEILRALHRLIASGQLPRPRRTIHFVWPQEISGTYAFFKQYPGFTDRASVNINMDMVGEGLRQNNSVLRMFECPFHLPSYIDGLARSFLNYVWRTNDIIFLPDAPRGRPGGQYFPIPMLEKNGSLDAFRFDIHPATGGSDHICFTNPSIGVPGMMFLVWPDQWYHADTDTPDKSDPTQLKRMAFIGAACAWAAAHCTDDVVGGLADAVSEHGYLRIAEREIPLALVHLQTAQANNLASETERALKLVTFGAARETAALRTIEEVFSGSPAARKTLEARVRHWELYNKALRMQIKEYAQSRAAELNIAPPPERPPDELQRKCERIIPAIGDSLQGREFNLLGAEKYNQYLREHPNALKALGLSRQQATTILNYVNGKRSVAEISNCVAAELDEDVPLQGVAGYLELLKAVGLVVLEDRPTSL